MGIVVGAATLWTLFSLFLMLPLLGAPRELQRAASALLVLQLVMLIGSGYGRGVAYVLATQDIPALTVGLLGTAVAYGLLAGRDRVPHRK